MVTHRSRNKLERKAHMNIHDTMDVSLDEVRRASRSSSYTKDRFGKKHALGTLHEESHN